MRKTITPPRVHLAFGLISFLLGFAFIIGGHARATAPIFAVVNHQGGPYIWGTVFVVLGVALILSVNRLALMRGLLIASAIAYAVLAAAFLITSMTYSAANFTGVIAYGGYSMLHLCAFYRSRYSMIEHRNKLRLNELRILLHEYAMNTVQTRVGDDDSDSAAVCCIVLERAAAILSPDWLE